MIIILGACCCLASCIKDEAPNKECDIESAWIEGADYEAYFYQTTEMRKEAISSAETDIVFSVRSGSATTTASSQLRSTASSAVLWALSARSLSARAPRMSLGFTPGTVFFSRSFFAPAEKPWATQPVRTGS